LVDGLDEGRLDVVYGERLVGETEDTIDGLIGEEGCEVGGLSEGASGHGQRVGTDISESDGVLALESLGGSGSVSDSPCLSVLDVGGGLGGVEEVLVGADGVSVGLGGLLAAVRVALDLAHELDIADGFAVGGLATVNIGDPQVGRSGVQNHLEGLLGSSDGDV
ncbi:hypothetical protein PFISCL1PPCAC_13330, partial [Pristionchus fissidentatus]